MHSLSIITDAYFDGSRHHPNGPFRIDVREGRVERIDRCARCESGAARGEVSGAAPGILQAPFVMPGLVEAHAHLFLDGGELDFEARQNYLRASPTAMLEKGRLNLELNLAAGITLVRDAGDIYGINTRLKLEMEGSEAVPEIVSAGKAIRRKGLYGSFMAVEANGPATLASTVMHLSSTADQLKILLTGIIDFEKGQMRGGLQFSLEEARVIVKTARELGLLTFAHCSGIDGLQAAVAAGVDSIEHGFFMNREVLESMCAQCIAWVPTFSPVYFQYEHPELSGWGEETVARLGSILENHFKQVHLASKIGVPLLTGSDAGSYGVPHGRSLIQEMLFQHEAGVAMEQVLASATSLPRRLWKHDSADICAGNKANMILLRNSPFHDPQSLFEVSSVIVGTKLYFPEGDFSVAAMSHGGDAEKRKG